MHSVAVTGQKDLVIREGESPCKVLKKYCRSLSPEIAVDSCEAQLHPLLVQQMASLWATLRHRIKADESFFIDCEPLRLQEAEGERQGGAGHGGLAVAAAANNSSAQVEEMLSLLRRAVEQRDARALQTFNGRRTQLKMSDWERLELYREAIMLIPNNLFIVDQLGLALLFLGEEARARRLFSNAVARGMWGNAMQRPVSKYVPGLASMPWHDKRDYPFIARLEQGYAGVREELLRNLEENGHIFTEEQEDLHVGGNWTELRLKSSGHGVTEHSSFFPKTMALIRGCGEEFTSIKFSAIQPGTHIRMHTGPSNERLRVHLTILHSGGARIRVGSEWRTWVQGEAIIFDDSWEHEVVHNGDELRVVLIMDIWHPDLPVDQRVVH